MLGRTMRVPVLEAIRNPQLPKWLALELFDRLPDARQRGRGSSV